MTLTRSAVNIRNSAKPNFSKNRSFLGQLLASLKFKVHRKSPLVKMFKTTFSFIKETFDQFEQHQERLYKKTSAYLKHY